MTLIERLITELDVTRQQAEGVLGLLLQQAQSRLSEEQFLRLAATIPAISDLIGKAPRIAGAELGPLRTAWQRMFGEWGELVPIRSACEGLGLDRAVIDKFIAVIGGFFREQGGQEIESLLKRAWQ